MNTAAAPRIAALALSSLFTVLMLVSVDHLATSQPPAGLMAQMAEPAASAPAKS
jgi:hypothetical protein